MMSWKKESAKLGMAGLIPRETAKGALMCEVFQKMPDPLDTGPFSDLFKEVKVLNDY